MAPDLGDAIRKLFKGGLFAVSGLIIEMGISFIAKVIAARYLGKLDYGAVSAGITVLGITSSVVLLGLHTGVARYLSRDDDPAFRRGVILSAISLWVPLALLAALLIFILAGPIAAIVFKDPSADPILRVFAVAIPLAAFSKFAVGTTQGTQTTLPKVLIDNLTIPLVRFVGVAAAFLLGLGALGIAGAYLGAYVAAAALGLFFLFKQTSIVEPTPPSYQHRDLLAFSIPLLVSGVAGLIYADLDTIIVGYFWGTQAIADYHVVYPVAQLVTLGLTGFSFIFMPVFSELHASERLVDMDRMYRVVTKWIALGTFPIFLGMVVFPEQVISVTFGEKYTTGALALSILAASFFLHALLGPNAKAVIAAGHSTKVMRITISAGILNLILNLLIVPQYSYVGAAFTTALTYGGMNVVYSWYLYQEYNISPFSPSMIRPLIGGGVLFLVAYIPFVAFTTASVTAVILFMALFAVGLLGLTVYLGGFQREELVLVRETEDRFGVDLQLVRRFLERHISDD